MRVFLLGTLIAAAVAGSAVAQSGPPEGPPPGDGRGPPPMGGRPGGGRLFLSPMGEPFRSTPGGPAPQDAWFAGADANHDGALNEDEMIADAMRFFALLDQRKDGEIDPDDIDRYEQVLAPEIRTGGMAAMGGGGGGGRRGRGEGGPPGGGGGGPPGGGAGGPPEGAEGGARAGGRRRGGSDGPQGAALFGYLPYPEPVTVADRNLNRGVDPVEWRKAAVQRFAMLDTNQDGRIEKGELPRLASGRGPRGKDGRESVPEER